MKAYWMNGALRSEDEAKVSVMDHGLLYGDGVFEGLRCVDGRVVDFDLHLERLRVSAAAIALSLPPRLELERAVMETLTALGEPSAYVRLLVTRGVGELGIDVASCGQPTLCCIAGKLTLYKPDEAGIKLATVSLRRPAFDMLDPRVKSLNYLNNVMAKMEAKRQGADEALVLNTRGTIAEASAANIFAVLDGVAVTPSPADGALSGITRRRMLELLREANIPARETSLTKVDLLGAREVFLTGTGAGIVPVGFLDGQALGRDRTVSRLLTEASQRYCASHGTPVPGLLPGPTSVVTPKDDVAVA